jgi:tetratricopeptide (TPR) repeat protein
MVTSEEPSTSLASHSSTSHSLTQSSNSSLTLTPQELAQLSDIDSRLFGILRLDEPSNSKTKSLIVKAIKTLEVALLQRTLLLEKSEKSAIEAKDEKAINELKSKPIDPKTYCKIGDLNLLLGNYAKALSAYQRYFSLNEDHWKDVRFLFSLGLVYFYYNAYHWAIKSFRQVLYIEPSFPRANEAHVRLGLIFKRLADYNLSHKHFLSVK